MNGVRAVESLQSLVLEIGIDTPIPGTKIAYTIPWTTEQRNGSYDATIEVSYEGKTASWSGVVLVGDEVLEATPWPAGSLHESPDRQTM